MLTYSIIGEVSIFNIVTLYAAIVEGWMNCHCCLRTVTSRRVVSCSSQAMFAVECDEGTFGVACAMSCHCENNVPCDRVSGVCPGNLCTSGWLGRSCQTGLITGVEWLHYIVNSVMRYVNVTLRSP